MKKFKKLVAVVAMLACCITMATPVTASAALTVCSHDGIKLYGERAIESVVDTHTFTIYLDTDGDRIPEPYYGVCEVVVVSHCEGFTCIKCRDYVVENVFATEYKGHSMGNVCPFASNK